MSKFVENTKIMPKSKWKQFKTLSRAVHAKRNDMRAAEQAITAYMQEYCLEDKNANRSECCITKFKNVCIDATGVAQIDDAGYVVHCSLFSTTDFCVNNKCPWHMLHMNYIVALDKYNVALQKRRDFIKGLFCFKSKTDKEKTC